MKDYEPFFQKLRSDIKTRGWSIVCVVGGENEPDFAYTVGLTTSFKHPEIVLFGLDFKNASAILNGVGDLVKKGEKFIPGVRYDNIFRDGYNAQFISVLPQNHSFISFAFEQRGEDVRALQLLFPDTENRFPLEEGFDNRHLPPLLNRLEV